MLAPQNSFPKTLFHFHGQNHHPHRIIIPTSQMSHSTSDDGLFGGGHGGFGYGIGISAGILLLITTITLASYFCTRDSRGGSEGGNQRVQGGAGEAQVMEVAEGIDEATLKTYPKCVYSELQMERSEKKGNSMVSCCSICLADYKGKDVIRLLPDCGHVFHLKCVDPWLRLNPTCPLCRTSPLPTPQSTPLIV